MFTLSSLLLLSNVTGFKGARYSRVCEMSRFEYAFSDGLCCVASAIWGCYDAGGGSYTTRGSFYGYVQVGTYEYADATVVAIDGYVSGWCDVQVSVEGTDGTVSVVFVSYDAYECGRLMGVSEVWDAFEKSVTK